MNDIGIGIKVDHGDVAAARKNLDGLKQSLEEARESSDFSVGSDATAMEGATKGAKQFKRELEGASAATAKIVKDYDKLIKTSASRVAINLTDRPRSTSSGAVSGSDYDAVLKREADKTRKPGRKTAAEQYYEQHGNYGATANGPEEGGKGGGGGGMLGGMMNKVGLLAAGAVTIGSAIAFLHHARQKYIEGATNESGLQMRGIHGTGMYLGNTRTEMQQHAASLAQQSGYTANDTLKSSMDFAAATGTDPSLGIGVMASSRDLAKDGAETGKRMLSILKIISDSTKDSPERINRLLSGSLNLFSKARGGAELTGKQIADIQSLTEALHKTGSQGRDAGTMGTLKDAMKSTGDPATDILKAKMLGVYDGEMSFDKAWDVKKREEEGLTNPQNRAEFNKLMKDRNIPKAQKYLLASKFFPGMNPTGVETMVNQTLGGLDEKGVATRSKQFATGPTGIDTSEYKATAGAGVRDRKARKEERLHGFGGPTDEAFGAWEDVVLDLGKTVLDSGLPGAVAKRAKKAAEVVQDFSKSQVAASLKEHPYLSVLSPGLVAIEGASNGTHSKRPSSEYGLWGTQPTRGWWDIGGKLANLMAEFLGPMLDRIRVMDISNPGDNAAKAPSTK